MARTHVIIPEEILEEIDERVGKRKRSEFLTNAAEKELKRLRRSELASKMAGSLRDVDIPGWESSEAAAEWVRQQRQWPDPWEEAEKNRAE
jgi:metal-responsive CopG/Arc/MetJ family transcriptional regulator